MRQVESYTIIKAESADLLASRVREQILKGLQPFGSPSFGSGIYIQAMVKYQEPFTSLGGPV